MFQEAEKGGLINSAVTIKEITNATPFHHNWIVLHLPIFMQILILASLILVFWKKLWKEKIFIFIILFTCLSFIMTTKIFPWIYISGVLQTLQFPWRLALYIMFGGVLLCGVVINYFKDKKYFNIIYWILLIVSFLGLYYYIGHPDSDIIDLNNIDYVRGMGNEKEYLPAKSDDLNYNFVIHSGDGKFDILLDDVPLLVFEATLEEACKVELPRLYYPGYKLEHNGESIKLEEGKNGYLQAILPSNGIYTLTYEKTIVMKISWIVTLAIATAVIIVIVRKKEN